MIFKTNKICKICGTNQSTCPLIGNIMREHWYKNRFTPGNGWLCRNCYNGFVTGWTYSTIEFETNSLNRSITGEITI